MTRTRALLFVATEDWFVLSHFAPMVARAIAERFPQTVAASPTVGSVVARAGSDCSADGAFARSGAG
jgi:hypothetical protein